MILAYVADPNLFRALVVWYVSNNCARSHFYFSHWVYSLLDGRSLEFEVSKDRSLFCQSKSVSYGSTYKYATVSVVP